MRVPAQEKDVKHHTCGGVFGQYWYDGESAARATEVIVVLGNYWLFEVSNNTECTEFETLCCLHLIVEALAQAASARLRLLDRQPHAHSERGAPTPCKVPRRTP